MLLTSNGSCAEGVEWPTPCSCTRRRQAAAAGRQQRCSCSCRSLVLRTSAVKCRCGQSLALRTPVLSAGVCRGAINNLSPQTLHSVAGTINMSVIARWTSVCGCSTQHPQRTGPKINTSTILGFHFCFFFFLFFSRHALELDCALHGNNHAIAGTAIRAA